MKYFHFHVLEYYDQWVHWSKDMFLFGVVVFLLIIWIKLFLYYDRH